MNERKIRELFQQTGETLQAILDYFRLKDKVLWTGMESSGTITVPDIDKYESVAIYFWRGQYPPAICKVMSTAVSGGGIITGITESDVVSTVAVRLGRNGNKLTILTGNNNTRGLHHVSAGTHTNYSVNIRKIVGLDPVIPDSLKNLIGGGTA